MNQEQKDTKQTEIAEIYASDSPINDAKEDLLGWSKFADRIANALIDNKSHKGFVIGIQGKWGSGKSSLLNLVANRLEKCNNVEILRYNPWMLPDINHLSFFFSELAKVAKFKAKEEEYSDKLLRYGALLRITEGAKETGKSFYDVLLALFAGGALVTAPETVPNWIGNLSIILLITTLIAKLVHPWLESKFERVKNQLEEKQTLSEFKKDLNSYLPSNGTLYVVLVDDIDRLPPHQICEIFQLVKNNGDLANISYVLAYDKQVVRKVLRDYYNSKAYESFTEKIVQIEFDLPYPDSVILSEYFLKELDKILKDKLPESAERYWDAERWTNHYELYLRSMIKTLRQSKRILNAIRFNIHHVVNEDDVEVNPIDFIVIEMLRIQFPKTYDFIRDNKDVFVPISRPTELFGISKEDKKKLYRALEDELATIKDERIRENLQSILVELFPQIKELESKNEL